MGEGQRQVRLEIETWRHSWLYFLLCFLLWLKLLPEKTNVTCFIIKQKPCTRGSFRFFPLPLPATLPPTPNTFTSWTKVFVNIADFSSASSLIHVFIYKEVGGFLFHFWVFHLAKKLVSYPSSSESQWNGHGGWGLWTSLQTGNAGLWILVQN